MGWIVSLLMAARRRQRPLGSYLNSLMVLQALNWSSLIELWASSLQGSLTICHLQTIRRKAIQPRSVAPREDSRDDVRSIPTNMLRALKLRKESFSFVCFCTPAEHLLPFGGLLHDQLYFIFAQTRSYSPFVFPVLTVVQVAPLTLPWFEPIES